MYINTAKFWVHSVLLEQTILMKTKSLFITSIIWMRLCDGPIDSFEILDPVWRGSTNEHITHCLFVSISQTFLLKTNREYVYPVELDVGWNELICFGGLLSTMTNIYTSVSVIRWRKNHWIILHTSHYEILGHWNLKLFIFQGEDLRKIIITFEQLS